MTRQNEDLEQVLRPWMQRHAPDAPNELVLRILGEIDTMSEHAPSQNRLSRFAAWPATAWAATAVAVAAIAVAGGIFLTNLLGAPSVGNVATMSPAPTQASPTAVADNLIAAWNAGDGQQAASLYARYAQVGFMVDSPGFSPLLYTASDVTSAVQSWHDNGSVLTRTGSVLTEGPFIAYSVTWTSSGGTFAGVEVLRVSAGLVSEHYRIAVSSSGPSGTPPALDATKLVDDLLAAQNASDGSTASSLLAADAQGWVVGDGSLKNNVTDRSHFVQAINSGTACCETRTSSVETQGPFVLFSDTLTNPSLPPGEEHQEIQIFELNGAGQIHYLWEIGTRITLSATPAPSASGG